MASYSIALDGNSAAVALVDSNLHRQNLLPSEKAFAYKIKAEAISHKGKTCGQTGHNSRDNVSELDSGRQVQRYIRLTYLVPEILTMVDEGKIALSPAVEISYLPENEQSVLYNEMVYSDCTPSHSQTIRMKNLSQTGELTENVIREIMSEQKPNQREQIKLRREDFIKFFPASYTDEQIKADLIKGLELLHRQRQRNRDAW